MESEKHGIGARRKRTRCDLRQSTRRLIDGEGGDILRLRRGVDEEDPVVKGIYTFPVRLNREPRIDAGGSNIRRRGKCAGRWIDDEWRDVIRNRIHVSELA